MGRGSNGRKKTYAYNKKPGSAIWQSVDDNQSALGRLLIDRPIISLSPKIGELLFEARRYLGHVNISCWLIKPLGVMYDLSAVSHWFSQQSSPSNNISLSLGDYITTGPQQCVSVCVCVTHSENVSCTLESQINNYLILVLCIALSLSLSLSLSVCVCLLLQTSSRSQNTADISLLVFGVVQAISQSSESVDTL